ncbi:MAG: class I SAM-dependent methyltransferase [Sphingomonadaceae bacterium]|uniref:class I SAM-dependent methyltransferase n=1 Tax=Thermaurantiacus sp. TaxID=2820283 RepID=UPI00298EEBB5|nr:class I SAM-dependent methyltransferase [Thermaurantiacus sp.]MCS6987568.1 class I SAM-dependent methyltransferase [Sphingomonadaceae bacterium]MDW8415169.1 class I SAM-dependent methyltransferase [Thermaurantiacus sp.]
MKRIEEQEAHAALAFGDHDDRARADFAFTLRHHVTQHWMPGTRLVFDARARHAFRAARGRDPQSPDEIRQAMDADPWYRFYLSARRASQEAIWAAVVPPAERLGPMPMPQRPRGSLKLDPSVRAPAYMAAIDIHCMPGGYLLDRGEGDTAAGAVYDRGVYLYMSGLMGPRNDAVGRLAVAHLQARLPHFRPTRILDVGCGVGHATLPWAEAFPEAQVTGIDVGAALLRHAHLRAEAFGLGVEFVQADAEATPFPDGAFDLVTSAIVLHETSIRGLRRILGECHRLLAPGGVMLHVDQPPFDPDDPWATFLQENETHYNNEPFWRRFRHLDLAAEARAAGFGRVELGTLAAEVVRQSQNNAPDDPRARSRGFLALLAFRDG